MDTLVVCPACGKSVETEGGLLTCSACGASLASVTPTRAPAAPAPPEEILAANEVIGGYQIERMLGRGGMGAVYLATQASLGRQVALKVLAPRYAQDPAFILRFSRESSVLAALNHPNIIHIIDRGVDRERYFFVMEFVDGMNLRQALHKGRLGPEEAVRIALPFCEALEYAHAKGVVHRDLKPENLMLTKDGRVKIADFGLARIAEGSAVSSPALTMTQTVMGTPDYMAPESRRSAKEADHRADIYALGVMLYEMLTGNLPVGKFPPPSQAAGVDARLDEVVHKALSPDPESRYQRASEVAAALSHLSTRPPSSAPRPRRLLPALGLAAALAVALAAWWAVHRGPTGTTAVYDALVKSCVTEGRVDYEILRTKQPQLDAYLASLDGQDPSSLGRDGRLAFWINAYNALALKRALEGGPGLRSIRHVPDWETRRDLGVGGKRYSLSDIDEVLHGLGEPGARFLQTPAAAGAPAFPPQALTGSNLDDQLATAATRFLADPDRGFRAGVENRVLRKDRAVIRLSPLFRRYATDFPRDNAALLAWLAPRLPAEAQDFLTRHPQAEVDYLEEDWDLNAR